MSGYQVAPVGACAARCSGCYQHRGHAALCQLCVIGHQTSFDSGSACRSSGLSPTTGYSLAAKSLPAVCSIAKREVPHDLARIMAI